MKLGAMTSFRNRWMPRPQTTWAMLRAIGHRTGAGSHAPVAADRGAGALVVLPSAQVQDVFGRSSALRPPIFGAHYGRERDGKDWWHGRFHYVSERKLRPFFAVNAPPSQNAREARSLVRKRVPVTGRMWDDDRLFELAEGGTLLLDELGEMPTYQANCALCWRSESYGRLGGEPSRMWTSGVLRLRLIAIPKRRSSAGQSGGRDLFIA